MTPPSPKLPDITNALTPAEKIKEPSITKSIFLYFCSKTPTPFTTITIKMLAQSHHFLQYTFKN